MINQLLYLFAGLFLPKGARRNFWNGVRIGKFLTRGLF